MTRKRQLRFRPIPLRFGVDGGRIKRLFSDLSDHELEIIERSSTILVFSPGDTLIREAERGTEFFIILDGTATVWRGGRFVARLGAGDHCGELSLLTHEPRNATVVAETAITARVFELREFAGVIDATPRLVRRMLITAAGRLREGDIVTRRSA